MSNISIENKNNYTNLSYTDNLAEDGTLKSGVAFTIDEKNLNLQSFLVDESNKPAGKNYFKKEF